MSTSDSSHDRDPLDRMAEEFVARHRNGEHPALSEYIDRFPELAEQIRELFPALVMMEDLKPAADLTGAFDLATSQLDETPLRRLGEYRILREVGRGGMGVVYEAVQESLGRHVALKVLPTQGRADPMQMERFQLEARSAARLHHTHIVPVYGFGSHEGSHFYAMQFIAGCGLDAVIRDLRRLRPGAGSPATDAIPLEGATQSDASLSMTAAERMMSGGLASVQTAAAGSPLPRPSDASSLSERSVPAYFRSLARMGMQVADALAHAHGQGVLHRDIKPSNLLLDADGNVWVTDFGLAKVEGGEDLTRTGDIVGTLRYMAPERFDGWSDPRSDIYGLGMTLYELLTLRPAHDASDRLKLIESVLHESPPSPRRLSPSVPRDLETIVLKAIAKEPGERYTTARAFAEDLDNFLVGKPIKARRVGPLETAWRWCRRNPAAAGLVGVSGIAMLMLIGLGFAIAYQSRLQAAYGAKDEALARELTFLYENRVVFAERELNDNSTHRAEQLLDECPPERRNWEWNYLKRQCHAELMTIEAHQSAIRALAVSPDGRLIATGASRDSRLRLWNAETGREQSTLAEDVSGVNSVAFSPDGTLIASTGGMSTLPGQLRVREVATGRTVPMIRLNTGAESSAVFNTDGQKIVVASGDATSQQWVKVCEARSGNELLTIPTGSGAVSSARFSPDGRRLVAITGPTNTFSSKEMVREAHIWNSKTGQVQFVLRGNAKPLMCAEFSPDGRMIAAAGYDSIVRIHDAADGHEQLALRSHRDCVNSVAFSPDNRRIASTSDDGSAKIWDTQTGKEQITFRGHLGGFYAIVFSRDGRRLFTSGYDGKVKIWDATQNPEARTFSASEGIVSTLAFSPDSRRLVTSGGDRSVKLWEVSSGRLAATWDGHKEPVQALAISPDGRRVASAAGDWHKLDALGELIIWDAETGKLIHSLRAHEAVIWCVAFSPDGTRLISGGGEIQSPGDEVIVWDVATGKRLRTIPGLPNGVVSVSYSPDGRKIAAGVGSVIKIWDTETAENPTTFEGHTGNDYVRGLAFSPDGRKLFSTATDGTMRIWDSSSSRLLQHMSSDRYMTQGMDLSPDGRRIASVGSDRTVKIWDADSGQQLIALRGHSDEIRTVAFSPDGRLIASADAAGEVKIWDGSPWVEAPPQSGWKRPADGGSESP